MTPITGAVYERPLVKVRSKSVVMLCDEKGTPTSPRSRGDGGTCRRAGIHRVERGRERRRWVRRSSCRGAVGLERHRQRDDQRAAGYLACAGFAPGRRKEAQAGSAPGEALHAAVRAVVARRQRTATRRAREATGPSRRRTGE